MSLKLDRFDPATQIPKHSIITVIGKRNTGKSTMVKSLLYKLRDRVEFCLCFTPTASSAEAFAQVMPRACVYDKLDMEVIDRLMAYQSDCANRGKRLRSCCVLLDDCSWEAAHFKRPAPTLAQLYRNGRHLAIFVICVLQDGLDYHVGLRGQCDSVFMLREGSLQMRKRLHSAYVPALTLPEFHSVMDAVTENYGALVVSNTVQKNSPSECLFWWRAKPALPPFRFVSDVFYRLSERVVPPSEKAVAPQMPHRKGGVFVEACGDDNTVVSA